MTQTDRINRWTARFASETTEANYQAFIFADNLRNNVVAMTIALPFFGVYAILDFLTLTDPTGPVIVRLAVVSSCLLVMTAFLTDWGRRRHEFLSGLMVLALGSVVLFIVWSEPGLQSSYYIGLIQGGVFVSFLLRISLFKSVSVLAALLAGFVAVAAMKGEGQQATAQSFILFTNVATCIFGIYLLQIYRRKDFQKSTVIARQNEKLAEMLAAVQSDNERKVAALNTLIHVVRTPIHQIVGFTDLILSSLRQTQAPEAAAQIEHAELVKQASAELAQNVSKLLTYHQLEENNKTEEPDLLSLADMLADARERLQERMECTLANKPRAIRNFVDTAKVAFDCMERHFADVRTGAKSVEISTSETAAGVEVAFAYEGAPLTPDSFAELVKPLTKIHNYLTAGGFAMPMALRTAARAAEICGGALAFRRDGDKNVLTLSFADMAKAGRGDNEVEAA